MHFFSALSLGLRVWDRVRDRQQSVPIIVHDQNAQRIFASSEAPIQVVDANDQEGNLKDYKAKPAKILGALQIVSGLFILICQIVVTVLRAHAYEGYVGFWAPVPFILAGAFGIQSSKSKSRCTVITTMVLSIISAYFSMALIGAGYIGIALAYEDCDFPYYDEYNEDCANYGDNVNVRRTAKAFYSIMLIFGVLEGIFSVIASVLCCHGCCGRDGCSRCCNGCCYQSGPGVIISQEVPMTQGFVSMRAGYYQHTSTVHPVSPVPMTLKPDIRHLDTPGFYPGSPMSMPSQPQNTAPPAYAETV